MHWNHGWWGMGAMWLFWLVVLIVAVALIGWLIRRTQVQSSTGRASSAEEILKERYARGEIDKQEYEERLTELRR